MRNLTLSIWAIVSIVTIISLTPSFTSPSSSTDEEYFEESCSDTVLLSESEQIMKQERLYASEIDSLVLALTGQEIDADRIDIENVQEMEGEAYRLLGAYFYVWRQRESMQAWDYDVLIARYAY